MQPRALSEPILDAFKTQIWCAIATYVLIVIIEKELQLDASLYSGLQILSVPIFEKTQISRALQQTISNPLHCHANHPPTGH